MKISWQPFTAGPRRNLVASHSDTGAFTRCTINEHMWTTQLCKHDKVKIDNYEFEDKVKIDYLHGSRHHEQV